MKNTFLLFILVIIMIVISSRLHGIEKSMVIIATPPKTHNQVTTSDGQPRPLTLAYDYFIDVDSAGTHIYDSEGHQLAYARIGNFDETIDSLNQ